MEYNISQKVNKENGRSTFTIEGDKEFTAYINSLFSTFKDVLLQMPFAIGKFNKVIKPSPDFQYIIKIDDEIAEAILLKNPDITDKIKLVKDSDGNTLGLQVKL